MIYAMHGVVQALKANSFEHRNLLDSDVFESYLSKREAFVDLHDAIRGAGDALTIDDATPAAAYAAQLAVGYGHEVTIFVNGFNVEYQHLYCFTVVNRLLDITQVPRIRFRGEEYIISTFQQKMLFRKQIKRLFRHFKHKNEEIIFLEQLSGGYKKICVNDINQHLFLMEDIYADYT